MSVLIRLPALPEIDRPDPEPLDHQAGGHVIGSHDEQQDPETLADLLPFYEAACQAVPIVGPGIIGPFCYMGRAAVPGHRRGSDPS